MMRPILVAALITLVVTGLRVVGEIEAWDERWFSREVGGGASPIGISWLPIVFGIWFGRRLGKQGRGPSSRVRAILLPLIGFLLVPASWYVAAKVLGLSVTASMYAFCGAAWVGALLSMAAWPALFGANLIYGVLARLPVIAVTWLAVAQGWNVHYVKLTSDMAQMTGNELAMFLSVAQVGFWIPYTIMVGGFFGGLWAALTRR